MEKEERPWGHYIVTDQGNRYKVKSIHVDPGASLSLQKHYHRAEHWVVVEGTAKVEVDGKETLIYENQTTYIPLGAILLTLFITALPAASDTDPLNLT